jgi:hypothetical protein
MKLIESFLPATVFVVSIILPLTSTAAAPSFTETFDTTVYMDPVNTTAFWNTSQGELRLFEFTPQMLSNRWVGFSKGLAVSGDLAILAADSDGLQVFNIADPSNPLGHINFNMPGSPQDVVAYGNLAVMASGVWGLQIAEFTEFDTRILRGRYDTPGVAYRVAVAGNFAFVADGPGGLVIIDITDPDVLTAEYTLALPDMTNDVVVSGDLAFVANNTLIWALDVSNPASPLIRDIYSSAGPVEGLAVSGDLLIAAEGLTGLEIIDITDPGQLTQVGLYDTPGQAHQVAVSGDLLMVADGTSNLQVIDITVPSSPTLVGFYDLPGTSNDVSLSGNLAVVTGDGEGMSIVEIFQPIEAPYNLATVDTPGTVTGVAVAGDLTFVADNNYGLKVYDSSDLSDPQLVGTFGAVGHTSGIVVAGDHAFLSDNDLGLQVIDVSDPGSPALLGALGTTGDARGLAVDGDFVFVADGPSGLQIIDVGTPSSPALITTYGTTDKAQNVAVAGDLVFVADRSGGLQIIDVTHPAVPQLVSIYPTVNAVFDVAVSGELVFLTVFGTGLEIVDIHNPASPVQVGIYPSSVPVGVAVSGNQVFFTDQNDGLRAVDIVDPTSPVLQAQFSLPGDGFDVTLAGEIAFVADGYAGFDVIQMAQHEVDLRRNIGQSLPVDGDDLTILHVRLTPSLAYWANWSISGDGGVNWQPVWSSSIWPTPSWVPLAVPGNDLVWRSEHIWTTPGYSAAVSDLHVEWLLEMATIETIKDVGGDQGRQVRLSWQRSGHDFVGDTEQIYQYAVYRKVDDSLGTELALKSQANPGDHTDPSGLKLAGWDFVTVVPATAEDDYSVIVPTLADSTETGGQHWTHYMVRSLTATPGAFYDSPPDSGYSVDNLAPGIPLGILAGYQAEGVVLDWEDAPETDFRYYRIYRDTEPGFEPSPANLVIEVATSAWSDPTADPWDYHYKITVLDFAGNESEAGSPENVSVVPDVAAASRTALMGAVPNPFNPSTKLSFKIAAAGHVRLKVYDTAGRMVVTLLDEHRDAGNHDEIWDGRDNTGRMSSAGVYLYRLETNHHVETKRMTLVK